MTEIYKVEIEIGLHDDFEEFVFADSKIEAKETVRRMLRDMQSGSQRFKIDDVEMINERTTSDYFYELARRRAYANHMEGYG